MTGYDTRKIQKTTYHRGPVSRRTPARARHQNITYISQKINCSSHPTSSEGRSRSSVPPKQSSDSTHNTGSCTPTRDWHKKSKDKKKQLQTITLTWLQIEHEWHPLLETGATLLWINRHFSLYEGIDTPKVDNSLAYLEKGVRKSQGVELVGQLLLHDCATLPIDNLNFLLIIKLTLFLYLFSKSYWLYMLKGEVK